MASTEERALEGPAPRTRTGTVVYNEAQVAEILRRTVELERGQAKSNSGLSLNEIEAIARESGLDSSLVRVAARSLDRKRQEETLGARIAGAPVTRTFERVVEGEIDASHHEDLFAHLREAVGPLALRAPIFSTIGRTLALSVRTQTATIEATIAPRDGKTWIRIDVGVGQLAGGLFGGLTAGVSGFLAPLAVALSIKAQAGVTVAVVGALGSVAGVFLLARSLFSWRAGSLYGRMEGLAESLDALVRKILANPLRDAN
jgi:hypothetical protein